ncbi:MAG: amino acid ABC transporter permease [Clostridiaceae bacterium]|nr:amino acid ABC transporter permease [Clostridiaceae bacterium]
MNESTLLYMLDGTFTAIKLFVLTILISLPLGLLVAKGRLSKRIWINGPIKIYLLIMRGTPLILQLIFFMYAPPMLFGLTIDRFLAAVLAFALNYAAYFAEIYRGGIEAVPIGQYEAGKVLGLTGTQTFIRIILPQVIKRILPACGNEFMTLVKDTALAQTIGVAELFRAAQNTSSRLVSIIPVVIAGVFYLIMNSVVSTSFVLAEKKLDYYRG